MLVNDEKISDEREQKFTGREKGGGDQEQRWITEQMGLMCLEKRDGRVGKKQRISYNMENKVQVLL